MRLHQHERSDWLLFVFPQEQSAWPNVFWVEDKDCSQLIANKYLFEQKLSEAGINTTKTFLVLRQGECLPESLFQRETFFIKPNSANAMRGCYKYSLDGAIPRLEGCDINGMYQQVYGADEIRSTLEALSSACDLLIQDVLNNSADIAKLFKADTLITLRVVSFLAKSGQAAEIAYVNLELPLANGKWEVVALDPSTGEYFDNDAEQRVGPSPLVALSSLDWLEIQAEISRAHILVDGVAALGWDLAFTDKGVVIIEANVGWDIVTPQWLSDTPLLSLPLAAN